MAKKYDFMDQKQTTPYRKIVLITIMVIVAFILIYGSFFVVQAGERGIVFNNFVGMKEKIYDEGMHFKIPIFEKAIKMNIRTQKQEELTTAASQDLQDVSTTVAVNYMVDRNRLIEIFRNIGQATANEDYMQTTVMNPIINEVVKQTTAKYTAENLISKRPEVKKEIDNALISRFSQYGIIVIDVSITEFKFSPEFTKAIESKVVAEQNALKEQNNLKVVQFQAQQKVERAKGDAQASIELAKGNAESIRIVNEELAKSQPNYINYITIEKWNGEMPKALGSNSILSITDQPK